MQEDGVWRTIRGRRVFIRTGEDLDSAMKRSGKFDDYFKGQEEKLRHRPSTVYGDASNFEKNMPQIFEHPEWYDYHEEGFKEAYNALKDVRNNPEKEIIIYRATKDSDEIELGDWVTPSKTYAMHHNYSNLNNEGKVISKKVKAKDIKFAGDSLLEFGYYPY